MKLKIFNAENSASFRMGESRIYFAVAGCNTISSTAIRELDLKASDMISIAQDEEDPRTFYLFVDKKEGFKLRDYSKGVGKETGSGLAFNNANVSREVMKAAETERKTLSCKLITKPVIIDKIKYYPIIVPKAE